MFKSRKRHVNFLIIPDGSSRDINFKLSYWKIWMILGLLVFLIITLIILSVLYGKVLSGVISSKSLRQENERLKKYNARVVELEKELQEYRGFARKVAELAGIEFPFTTNPQKREIKVAFSHEDTSALNEPRIPSSLKNTDTDSELPEIYYPPILATPRVTQKGKTKVESDSLRHIPRGQPMGGWTTKGFSLGEQVFGGGHSGVDFAAKEGTEVKATADGKVSFVGWDEVYGNLVAVDHGNGYVTYYGHNSKILVNSGDSVKRGEVIALSGNSGRSSAPHLHYEIRKNDIPVDPKDFINPK